MLIRYVAVALMLTLTSISTAAIEPGSDADFEAGRTLLAKIQAQAATRKPVLDRTHVLVRTQSKYAARLYRDFYLWHDRPLFANRMLWENSKSDYKHASIRKTYELYRMYGLDGIAMFVEQGYERTYKPFYDAASRMELEPNELNIMLELHSTRMEVKDDRTLDLILNSPHSFQINGRSVMTSHVMDRLTPTQLKSRIEALRKRSGDRTLFLPLIQFKRLKDARGDRCDAHNMATMYRKHGALPASLLANVQEYLRSYLRVSDGLYIGPFERNLDRTLDIKFYADVLYPVFKSVLAEPAFEAKLLAAQMKVGYTSYHSAQSLSRDGTKTLRAFFELAQQFEPASCWARNGMSLTKTPPSSRQSPSRCLHNGSSNIT